MDPEELLSSPGIGSNCAVLQRSATVEGLLCPVSPQATDRDGRGRFPHDVSGNCPIMSWRCLQTPPGMRGRKTPSKTNCASREGRGDQGTQEHVGGPCQPWSLTGDIQEQGDFVVEQNGLIPSVKSVMKVKFPQGIRCCANGGVKEHKRPVSAGLWWLFLEGLRMKQLSASKQGCLLEGNCCMGMQPPSSGLHLRDAVEIM